MITQNAKKFISSRDYLAATYEANKAANKSFSYRFFAKRLNWPISYLNDVVKGRKKLSISRALQFAAKFELSPAQLEHLIALCLADSEDAHVANYFRQQIEERRLQKAKTTTFGENSPLFLNPLAMILFELIGWGQGRYPSSLLVSLPQSATELQDLQTRERLLQVLLAKKVIRKTGADTYVQLESDVFSLDDLHFVSSDEEKKAISQIIIRGLEQLIKVYRHFTGRGMFFSSYLNISRDRLPEVLERYAAFRDWLVSISKEPRSQELSKQECFLVNIHIVPLFDAKDAEVKLRK